MTSSSLKEMFQSLNVAETVADGGVIDIFIAPRLTLVNLVLRLVAGRPLFSCQIKLSHAKRG
jgi:hypothetical protein